MCRFAADSDFAINDPDRRERRGALAPDPVWDPQHRHYRTFDERDRLRQCGEARRDPFALCRQKAQAGARRDTARQYQLDVMSDRVDP